MEKFADYLLGQYVLESWYIFDEKCIDKRVTAGDKVSDKEKEYLDFFRKFNSAKIGINFYLEKNDYSTRTMGRELYSLLKLMDSDVSKEIMALKVESYSSDGAV